ncbi:MAG: 4-hydroxy-3-methylbut-2-enyl diphosphate reductase [Verrucomicrobiota bacterium]
MPGTVKKKRRVNVRTPEVMERVHAEVATHYESSIVERVKQQGGVLTVGNTTIRLAQQFGFCYGVERAIDLAYASRRVFPENRIFLIGEIIHNPEVNRQLEDMKIVSLPWREMDEQYDDLSENDVVIVPAFGAPISFMDKVESQGCLTVDTTCGDVMKVWKRVRGFAKSGVTSIIHGKADHEETRATASRAEGDDGDGNYLIVLTLDDVDFVCDYIENGGNKEDFFAKFEGRMSVGFNPDTDLGRVGVANQTTMLKSETEEIQRRVRVAIETRDGGEIENFLVFDTICGATQERQDALFELLKREMDMLIVVGGYNSSNTQHLVEIGEKELPTFFIRSSDCIVSLEEIVHYDLHKEEEITSYSKIFGDEKDVTIGITAGASCPSNLIEDTIIKVFELRGISEAEVREP